MPTWDKILDEIKDTSTLKIVQRYINKLSIITGNTTICYMTAFSVVKPSVPSHYHAIIDQDMQGFMTCSYKVNKDNLDLILHTPGGDFEATKRIINYLHETYKKMRVFVPHMAMSGGTLIACAADEIYMGPYSSLGPTDPQVLIGDQFIPIDAISNEFDRAFQEVSEDSSRVLLWSDRLNQIPMGMRVLIDTMRAHSKSYLINLLKKRNCPNKSQQEIQEIAKFLLSSEEHSSHGKGIGLSEIKDRLNVFDLRENPNLEDAVLSIYHAAIIFFEGSDVQKLIINNKGKRFLHRYKL